MTREVNIRPANLQDAPALAAMRYELRAGFAAAAEDRDRFIARCERWMGERLLGGGSNWLCWVAEDGRLIGQAWLSLIEKVPNPAEEPELHGYVTNFYVLPEKRGLGVGGRLLARVLETCRDRGVDSVVLWSTEASRSLYRRHGFRGEGPLMELRRTETGTGPSES